MPEKPPPHTQNFWEKAYDATKRDFTRSRFNLWLKKSQNNITTFLKGFKNFQNIAKANYEIGRKHYTMGNFDDAILRFKFVTWRKPGHYEAWYWLGASYLAIDKKPAASAALKRALLLKPEWQDAKDMLKETSQL